MSVKLIATALYNAGLTAAVYTAVRKTSLGKLSYRKKQWIIGILFGIMAAFASTRLAGIDVGEGVIMNVRDAAPLCAGLIFGGPAGIIAGVIGGVYRYVSAIYGLTGTYTQVACSTATILAGMIAALLRKFMFDGKTPGWIYGCGIGMLCEVIHMLLIFFTNADDPATAFYFVKVCSPPMILCNAVSVGIAVFAVSIPGWSGKRAIAGKRHISRIFQTWLFICIVAAYALTGIYTYVLQSQMSSKETESVIERNIDDVKQDIVDMSDENLLAKTRRIEIEYLRSKDKSARFLSLLAKAYDVSEINIVDESGHIVNTNIPEYMGFDMNERQQSAEFLRLLEDGADYYIQEYQPRAYDSKTGRKYGGIVLAEGGFLQVGYDADEFRADIGSTVSRIAKNRHIGENGFIVLCGEDWKVVSEGSPYFGTDLRTQGIWPEAGGEREIFPLRLNGALHLCEYEFTEGYYIFGAIPESEALFMRDVSVYLSSFMEILIFAALFGLVYFLIKELILNNLVEVTRALSKIAGGNLDISVNVRANEEFASLSDDINSTVDTLKRYISEAEARIDAELEFAKQIQHSALPSVFPPYPDRREFDLYARMDTAKEVGGDFYDFYMLDDSTVAFLIADVSGKGIPAAMFMMKAKTIIKDLAESGLEVNEVFTQANKKLCENNGAGMFVTAWMAVVDLKTGLMRVANAGHNPPIFRRAGGKFAYEKERAGFVLAGMEGTRYRKIEIQLMPGDQIYLYTDGVTEATDKEKRLYGEERLLSFLNSLEGEEAGVESVCGAVKRDVDRFVGDAPQFDDITMVSFRLNFIREP